MARTSHQSSPPVARLKREGDSERRRSDKRLDDLEARATAIESAATALAARVTAIEGYLSGDLFTWLGDVEAIVTTGTGPPAPGF